MNNKFAAKVLREMRSKYYVELGDSDHLKMQDVITFLEKEEVWPKVGDQYFYIGYTGVTSDNWSKMDEENKDNIYVTGIYRTREGCREALKTCRKALGLI